MSAKTLKSRRFRTAARSRSFSLATTDSWKDKATGERKSATEWHNIVVKNEGLVGIVEKYVKKGSKLHIEGKLETRTYEKDGSKRYVTEIVLYPYSGEIVLLDAKDAPPDALEAAE